MTVHMVIPDSHTKPGVSNERFEWLAKFTLDLKPDVIVCIGDFFDCESLCSYDKGKKSFEGRRYKADIQAGVDALDRFHGIIDKHNKSKFFSKKRQYRPEFIFTTGNHENRVNRAIESEAILDGTISTDDFLLERFGWAVYPFLDVVERDGILYSHYFVKSGSNYAIGGENVARSVLLSNFRSSTFGHNHKVDYSEHRNSIGHIFLGHSAGNFLALDQYENYAGIQGNAKWSCPSVSVKRYVKDGQYQLEIVRLERLKEIYT